jgi:hypothetical protein
LVLLLSSLCACGKSDDTNAASGSSKPSTSPSAAKPAASPEKKPDAPEARKLAPLPLTLELPPSAKIEESPTGGALITDGTAKFSVGKLDKDFASEKKRIETFPLDTFTKWVKTEDTLAVAEFGTGTPNYRAVLMTEVGGQKYSCQNTGLPGAASAEAAEAVVKRCLALKPAP